MMADVGRFTDVGEIPSGGFYVSRNYETRSSVILGKEYGIGGQELAPSAALPARSQAQDISSVTVSSSGQRCSRAAVLKVLRLDRQLWQYL